MTGRDGRTRSPGKTSLLSLLSLLVFFSLCPSTRADGEPGVLFTQGALALKDGRVADAIGSFEALADRGVVDPVASYDRGLAYATRVHIGAEVPGDLGRAAQGFEEARDLSRDARLAEDASRALTVVRSEVARRRTRAGQPVEVDPGRSLGRTVAGLLDENTWAGSAVAASAILSLALFMHWLARVPRVRVASAVAAGVAGPVLVVSLAMTLAARHDRLGLREAVVVTPSARPIDDRGIAVSGATPLPEGARVEIVDARGASTRVRFGSIEVALPADALRDLAR
jgi:hypothetical protein